MNKDFSEERFVEQKVTYTLEIDGRFVIVENVPAPAKQAPRPNADTCFPIASSRASRRVVREIGMWKLRNCRAGLTQQFGPQYPINFSPDSRTKSLVSFVTNGAPARVAEVAMRRSMVAIRWPSLS